MNKQLLALAVKVGVPAATIADLARTVLGIKCPYCQLSSKILRHVNRLGEDKAVEMLTAILEAKRNKDEARLAELAKQFNGNYST